MIVCVICVSFSFCFSISLGPSLSLCRVFFSVEEQIGQAASVIEAGGWWLCWGVSWCACWCVLCGGLLCVLVVFCCVCVFVCVCVCVVCHYRMSHCGTDCCFLWLTHKP